MHSLVHVALLDVQVAVQVDDPDAAVDVRGDRANVGVADRMVAAQDDGEDPLADDPRDGPVDLVEALLDVGRDDEDVAEVDEVELLLEVHGHVDRVRIVESRDTSDRLRAEAAPGAIGRSHVEGGAENSHLVLADLVDVFEVGGLPKRVDPGERRLLPAGEGRDRPVVDRGCCLEAELESPLDRFPLLAVRDVSQPTEVAGAPKLPVVRFAVFGHEGLLSGSALS